MTKIVLIFVMNWTSLMIYTFICFTVLAHGGHVELHPRKRKIKASKDGHSRDQSKSESHETSTSLHNITHSNPYQMYIHIRKQVSLLINPLCIITLSTNCFLCYVTQFHFFKSVSLYNLSYRLTVVRKAYFR